MLLVDAHEDLAWNALTFGRDYTLSAAETRRREAGGEAPTHNGDTLLGWPDYQRGRVAVIFSTLFAAPIRRRRGAWDTQYYADTAQARTLYRTQMDFYHRLTDNHPDKFRLILTQSDLQDVLSHWKGDEQHGNSADITPDQEHPVGLLILMEGAESISSPAELEEWWESGVRLIGPAWAGTRFCGGTREPGPLTSEGFALLDGMADLGFTLDLSHMDERATLQALEHYPGSIITSHANALSLLKGSNSNRHLSDHTICGIIEREGLIGVVPFNTFLQAGWKRGDQRESVTLQHVAAQIDFICQMAGDSSHVGLGSDFDGGFGLQSTPVEIDTISDLQKLIPLLAKKGYTNTDITAILGENWIAHLQQQLPDNS